jgi:hypothetical protein
MQKKFLTTLFLFIVVFFAANSFAASEPMRLKIIYSSFTGAYTPLWLAVEEKLGP